MEKSEIQVYQPAMVAQSDTHPTGDQEVMGLIQCRVQQHSFMKIDHAIFSTVILLLRLIQERQYSVSGKGMCTSTG